MVSRPLMSPGVVKVCKICRRNVLVCKSVKKGVRENQLAQELLHFNFLQVGTYFAPYKSVEGGGK